MFGLFVSCDKLLSVTLLAQEIVDYSHPYEYGLYWKTLMDMENIKVGKDH